MSPPLEHQLRESKDLVCLARRSVLGTSHGVWHTVIGQADFRGINGADPVQGVQEPYRKSGRGSFTWRGGCTVLVIWWQLRGKLLVL